MSDKITYETDDIKLKLALIYDIWNHFIWEYRFCNSKVKFSDEVKTNYLGVILGYFKDTFEIIFTPQKTQRYSERFSYNISLLQAIYVHQDFVEEMLIVFKCNLTKGDLKADENYSLNRNIRNELIGHPIRKHEGKLVSSTSFSYESDPTKLVYLRYHKDNGFRFEPMEYDIQDILNRHRTFLNTYFDVMIRRLKIILQKFRKQLLALSQVTNNQNFEAVIKFTSSTFETFFKNTYGFDKASIIDSYSKYDEHPRYANLVEKFLSDLKQTLQETDTYITDIIGDNFDRVMDTDSDYGELTKESSENFNYELGKLATRRNVNDFIFFSNTLKRRFAKDSDIIAELDHMITYMDNDMEYYSAFYLLEKLINENGNRKTN